MMLSFAGIGVLPGALGPALDIDANTIRVAGAAMLIAFALVMLVPALGDRFPRWMLPIASAANAASTRLDGGSLLSAEAIPLVAVASASRSGFLRARHWILARVERVRRGFALLLGGMGIAILTGADKWVEARVLAWLPDAWVNLTIGI